MHPLKTALALLGMGYSVSINANVNTHFNQINSNPKALYAFFEKMPKGGELHYHLDGGPSPEVMLALVAQQENYCLNAHTLAISKDSKSCDGIKTNTITPQSKLYSQIIRDWSLEDFTPGKESKHDHFFNSFLKYASIVANYRPQLVANVVERAAAQNELYLEILDIPDNAKSTRFGALIKNASSYQQKREALLNNPKFQDNINQTAQTSDQLNQKTRTELACTKNPERRTCSITIKFIYCILREQNLDNFFAQALTAFEAVSRSQGNLIGINLVQAEDGPISVRDYHQQMLILNYLHRLYPQVHRTLHAGEITAELVRPAELKYHIHDALFTAKAQRIGHGVDIISEQKAEESIAYMAKHQIAIEINLISNYEVLNVAGAQHPLNYYLDHHVPVVLSTDDEGILRTNLTQQYVKAALDHHLNYPALKQINRNTLTYAFIAGKSIWANNATAELVPECRDLNDKTCKSFIAVNEKARLQWTLEKELNAFEQAF